MNGKIWRIPALKYIGQKSFKFFGSYFGKLMISYIHSDFNRLDTCIISIEKDLLANLVKIHIWNDGKPKKNVLGLVLWLFYFSMPHIQLYFLYSVVVVCSCFILYWGRLSCDVHIMKFSYWVIEIEQCSNLFDFILMILI